MPYSPFAIANGFLKLGFGEKKEISPLKIQKLVYFSHGLNLSEYNEPLITEPIEAWKFGPVISSLYHEFKPYGNGKILEYALVLKREDNGELKFIRPTIQDSDSNTREIIEAVWEAFKNTNAVDLSSMTHMDGSPWKQVWIEGLPKNTPIPDDIIKAYFKSLVA